MIKVHISGNRLACAAGLVAPERPERHTLSPGLIATVLAAVVGLMAIYVGVREMTQPGSYIDELGYERARSLQDIVSDAGSARLMSIEDMNKLAGD